MKNTVIFDGHDLGELVRIRWEVDEQILPSVYDKTNDLGNFDGEDFISRKFGTRQIIIPYVMFGASQEKRQELTTILGVKTPRKLVLTDRPDTYYMAIPNGDIEYGKHGAIDVSTITFIASDPMRYATDLKTFIMNDDHTITIENSGNQPTPISFSAIVNDEMGYLGLVSEQDVIQIGDPAEQDKVAVAETFQALNNTFLNADELTEWQSNKYKSSYPNSSALTGVFGVHGSNRGVVQVMYSGRGQVRLKRADNTWTNHYVSKETAWKVFDFCSVGVLIGTDEWLPYAYCKITISDPLNEGVYAYNKSGVKITTRKFSNGSAWHVTGGFKLNGDLYFQVATDQFIRADDTYVSGTAYVSNYQVGTTQNVWYGPSIYRQFKTDQFGNTTAKNWKMTATVNTVYNNVNALGVQELASVDGSGKAIAGFRFRKVGYGSSVMQLYMFVGDKIIKRWEGNTDWFLKDFMGVFTVQKVGADFTFTVNNSKTNVHGTYHYSDNSLSTVQGAGVNYWVGAINGRPQIRAELMDVNVVTSAEGFADVVNSFKIGDRIDINTTDMSVKNYLNNQPQLGMQALGSTPIMAPVGTSRIIVGWSSFTMSPPLVVATIRERWL